LRNETRLLFSVILFGMSCSQQHPAEPTSKSGALSAAAKPAPDSSDALIQHLLRRIDKLSQEITAQEKMTLQHDNECMESEIAILEGRPDPHRRKAPNAAQAQTLSAHMQIGLTRIIQNLLDGQAAIDEHNRKHPEDKWVGVEDALRQVCGDCVKERAERTAEIATEIAPREH
jgi:hypothetical protein